MSITISNDNTDTVQFCRVKKNKEKTDTYYVWLKSFYSKDKESTWCFTSLKDKKELIYMSGIEHSKNKYEIELIPLIEFLEWTIDTRLIVKPEIVVYTESLYVINCINEWIDKWNKHDFIINSAERPNSRILKKIYKYKLSTNLELKLLNSENDFNHIS